MPKKDLLMPETWRNRYLSYFYNIFNCQMWFCKGLSIAGCAMACYCLHVLELIIIVIIILFLLFLLKKRHKMKKCIAYMASMCPHRISTNDNLKFVLFIALLFSFVSASFRQRWEDCASQCFSWCDHHGPSKGWNSTVRILGRRWWF